MGEKGYHIQVRLPNLILTFYTQLTQMHNLNDRVINGSSTLEKSRVEALMANALAVWAPHGNLRFKSLSSAADIQVSFASKDHGDGYKVFHL